MLFKSSTSSTQKSIYIDFWSKERFGFVCPVCDLSFRDNLALIDHFNSPQHVSKVFQQNRSAEEPHTELLDGGIRRATLKEVVTVMESLVAKRLNEKSLQPEDGPSFAERVEMRKSLKKRKEEAIGKA